MDIHTRLLESHVYNSLFSFLINWKGFKKGKQDISCIIIGLSFPLCGFNENTSLDQKSSKLAKLSLLKFPANFYAVTKF